MRSRRGTTTKNLLFTIHLYRIVMAKDIPGLYHHKHNSRRYGRVYHPSSTTSPKSHTHNQIKEHCPKRPALARSRSRPPSVHIPSEPGQDQESLAIQYGEEFYKYHSFGLAVTIVQRISHAGKTLTSYSGRLFYYCQSSYFLPLVPHAGESFTSQVLRICFFGLQAPQLSPI